MTHYYGSVTDDGIWEDCYDCGGEGWEDRHDEDPLWYGHEVYRCETCMGKGGWLIPWEEVGTMAAADATDDAERPAVTPQTVLSIPAEEGDGGQ